MTREIFLLADEFPETSGIYILRDGETPLYIGQTKNIRHRLLTHHKIHWIVPHYPNATIELVLCESSELCEKEKSLIESMRPLYNETHGGEMRSTYSISSSYVEEPQKIYWWNRGKVIAERNRVKREMVKRGKVKESK